MASQIAIKTGYTASGDATNPDLNDYDLYVNNVHMGILQFNKSINSILGTNAVEWNDLEITKATIELFLRDNMNKSGFYFTAGGTLIKKGVSLPSGWVHSGSKSLGDNTANQYDTIDITSLFTRIKESEKNGTSKPNNFTPNTSTWYLYVKNSGQTGNKRFARKSQRNSTFSINGQIDTKAHIYTGSIWEKGKPYIWTGGQWKQSKAYIYTGGQWKRF